MNASKLDIYSIGIVAANKPLSSHDIEVTPIEDFSMIDGEITDNTTPYKAKGSADGKSTYQLELDTTASIKAKWMPVGQANRYTAPDVRRGEMVMIYRFADTDEYYWVTMKDDLTLRKLETVIYAFSGTTDEFKGVGPSTHYFLEISTHKKLAHFHTSKANGEFCSYDVQINAAEGYVNIQDDVGNIFSLDSKNRRIELINQDGTHHDMDRRNFTLTVPDNTTIKTGKNTVVDTGQNTTINSGGNATVNTAGTTTIKSAQNVIEGPTLFKGATTFHGPMTAKSADGGSGGNFVIDGNMNVTKISTPNQIDTPSISGICSRPA